jgi:hypothetical protein
VGFVCSVCGEFHAERLLDIRMSFPDAIHALSEDERRARTWLSDDFAVLDERRFFVRGLLEIPIVDLDDCFGYGVWAELEREEFERLLEHWYDEGQAAAEPVAARLANDLAPFNETTGLLIELQPVSADRLPVVQLDEVDHPLCRAQQEGISSARCEELAATAFHA